MAIRTLITKLLQTGNLDSFLTPNSSPPVIQSGVSSRRASVRRKRSMRCEPLERRELLAAEVLPEIRSFADFPAFLNGSSNAALTQSESSAFTHTISPNDFSGFWEASDPTELISVEIRVDDAFSVQDAQAALAELDFEKTASFGWNLEGYLARGKMVEAAELPMVQVVRENSAAIFNAGTVSSQADPAMRSNLARSQFNVNGAGIKIGVISDSYSRTNGGGGAGGSVASGNLPGPGNPNGFTIPVTVLQDAPTMGPTAGNGKDEGRAMLELIHDIAPGAQLFFHTAITGPVQFAEAVQALSAAGVDIIVDDVTYAGMQIFQDGVTAQAVAQATSAGISFFSSAGNQGSEAYSALYQTDGRTSTIPNFPPTAGKVYEPHDFDPGPGVDNFQRVVLGSGRTTTITFQWDQPSASLGGPGASTDMDIIVFNEFGTPVSGGVQNNVGQDPIEIFALSNPTNSPLILEVGIFRNVSAGGPRPNIVHYHPLTSPTDFDIFQFETFGGTLFGHHQAPGVAAIAAVDYRQTPAFGVSPPGVQESTSEGGLPILFDTAGNRLATPEIRTQPVVTAPDTINNSFFGSPLDVEGDGIFNFAGTSAAAPNAAAVAALMLQAAGGRGSLTPAQIRAAMANTAIDIPLTGNGFDHFTGFGLIDANAAVAAVRNTNPPPPPPPPPPNPPSPSLIDREIGESGTFRVDQDWKTIQLQNAYVDPVVIASPASFGGSDPVTVRVRNVTSNSFQVRLQEWDYDDGNHSLETVSYLVVEKGSYALPDGRVLHAGTTSVNQNLKRVDFPDIFETSPVVLSQSQTDNGPAAIVTRQQDIGRVGFSVRLQEEEGADNSHSNERVGFVAIEAGTGNAAGTAYRVGRTGERISEAFASINLGTGFDDPPAFLAAMQTTTGADPAGLRFRNLDRDSVQVFVEEEQSADAETSHSDENVGFAAFEIGAILARAAMSNASLNQAVAMTSSNAASYDNNDDIAIDSNRDGSISSLDALVIINFLSNYSSSEPADVSLPNVVESFDANGDGFVTARDALVVINYLTKQSDIGSKTDENKTVPRWDADEVFASDEDFLLEHNLGISTDLF
ncbi:MAG: dockerin type I domain-containing protein [Rhodopirellula bahusiensis]|uniref:dockerin type I domain-containing protein n=2 Tax=Rhodopirellula bahusiensis TaxID=2014065 RepID=UPI003299CFD8